jgi:hypothetical protein
MVKAGGSGRDKAGFRWLIERDSPLARAYFRSLLTDESDGNRARGIYYLSQKLPKPELEEILVEYQNEPTYYYNVVTWFDRLLYSPSPLKEFFVRQLAKQVLR